MALWGVVIFRIFCHFPGKVSDRRECPPPPPPRCRVFPEVLPRTWNAFFNVSLPLFLHTLFLRYLFYLFFFKFNFQFLFYFIYLFVSMLQPLWYKTASRFFLFCFSLLQFSGRCVCFLSNNKHHPHKKKKKNCWLCF